MTTTDTKTFFVQTPLFPHYSEVRHLLKALAGFAKKSDVLQCINAIFNQTGTPQNQVDWSNPDEWIPQRLTGANKALAAKIWQDSNKSLNPRHIYGTYLFVNGFELLKADANGVFQYTERGKLFQADDFETVRAIDVTEGLPKLLAILAPHSPAKRGDLLEEWGSFLLAHSKFGKPSTIKDTLLRRTLNLVERGYILREGNTYTITDKGIAYAAETTDAAAVSADRQVLTVIKQHNDRQVAALRERLGKMNPYHFEGLMKDLLDAMKYEDVTVTKQSGDKGVDVIAHFQFGITRIKEVVQVKRHQASIGRPVLDQLRGALPLHGAFRGTIITLGKFAQGAKDVAFFPGAAPITLIDGDTLMKLLVENGIGVKNRPIKLLEVDESIFEDADLEAVPAISMAG
jgi:restriction system protein